MMAIFIGITSQRHRAVSLWWILCIIQSFLSLYLCRIDGLHIRNSNGNNMDASYGVLQYLIHNGQEFLEKMERNSVKTHWTTEEGKGESGGDSAILFDSPEAHLVIRVTLSSTFSISFKLKTIQRDGLIVYFGTTGEDFLAVELVGGHLRYIYEFGFGPRLLKSNLRQPISDNEWHHISIFWQGMSEHLLKIDNMTLSDVLPETDFFGHQGELYIGGVAANSYHKLPKKIRSKRGFQGCLSSLSLGEHGWDILAYGTSQIKGEFQQAIRRGCGGPFRDCSNVSCDNGGQCVQDKDAFLCYCDLTSFTGPFCKDDSIAYSFGKQGATISFIFDENTCLDMKIDSITFGITTHQSDAVLLRINSINLKDFLEVDMIDGSIFLEYNLGQSDHRIGELLYRINDNVYHVVNILRNGANAAVHIDNQMIYLYEAAGRQLNIFNCQSEIFIGGLRDSDQQLIHPFHGTLVGLVINGLRLLDLAAEGDDRMSMVGDIDLDTKPLKLQLSTTVKASAPRPLTRSNEDFTSTSKGGLHEDEDDLIYTNTEACIFEEKCRVEMLLSDSFILPVFKISTKESKYLTEPVSVALPLVSSISDELSEFRPCLIKNEACETTTKTERFLNDSDTRNMIWGQQFEENKVSSSTVSPTILKHDVALPTRIVNISSVNDRLPSSAQEYIHKVSLSQTEWHPIKEVVILVTATPHQQLQETAHSNGTAYFETDTEITKTFREVKSLDETSNTYPTMINIALISGVVVTIPVMLCALIYTMHKCCQQKVAQQEDKQLEQKLSNERYTSETNFDLQKRRDVKEWYV